MPNATEVGEARAALIVALADDSDFLSFVEDSSVVDSDDQNGVVILRLMFLFRDRAGKEVLTPHRRGQDEPYVLIEETRYAPDGRLDEYNYDVVFPAAGVHFGYHNHIHENRKYSHRQGFGVPGGHQSYPLMDIERNNVLWELISQAFVIDAAINP